jgi:hypothetical protein
VLCVCVCVCVCICVCVCVYVCVCVCVKYTYICIYRQAFALACMHRVKIESNFANVCIAIMVLEGVGRQLDPTLVYQGVCLCVCVYVRVFVCVGRELDPTLV